MPTPYTTIAGQSVERLAALSDGVFAIAMTLLVLDLRVPAAAALHGDGDLFRHVFVALGPRFVPYLLSFMSLGIYWIAQQTQLNHFARSDRTLTWIQLGFLLAVTLMPFSTALLAEYIGYRLAVVAYWLNLALLGGALFASVRYATRAGLLKDVVTADLRATHERRIVRYQMMYALAAALCLVSSYVSIGCSSSSSSAPCSICASRGGCSADELRGGGTRHGELPEAVSDSQTLRPTVQTWTACVA